MKRHHVLLSVALIVVAILAGCSNQSMYPKFPVAALIRQTGDIVKGQAFDASKFEVVVNYLDNTTQTISGAGIQYTDTNSNGMTADDTLKVNVGNDYYGKPVENTISPTVLDVVSIEAQAKNESYPLTYTKTEGFAVKAYYSETGFITLTPSDGYTVSISYADSVDQDSDEFKTATLVDGVATITFDNLSDTVAVKVSKPAGVIGTGEIKSINQLSDNQTFAFAALEYDEISADEIAESIKMVVTLDNGTTEGLVGQYATVASLGDAVTYKLVDSKTGSDFSTDWNSIDFVDAFGHKQLSGTASYLASFIAGEHGCKTRAIELSTLQRSASHTASRVDILEAYQVGGAAVKAADEGDSGKMVVLQRLSDDPYQCGTEVKDVHKIANDEKLVPREWVNADGTYVTNEFISYVRPLIQGDVSPVMVDGIPRHLYAPKELSHR